MTEKSDAEKAACKQTEARVFENSPCLKCEAVEPSMIRAGCLVFCRACFFSEFKPTDDSMVNIDGRYKKWLECYKEKYA